MTPADKKRLREWRRQSRGRNVAFRMAGRMMLLTFMTETSAKWYAELKNGKIL